MAEPRRAWVLNLDAEQELAGRASGAPARALAKRFEVLRAELRGLLPEGDLVLGPGDPSAIARGCAEGLWGRAWCPTPRALRCLSLAGARVPPAPSAELLRRVNHRAFCHALGALLEGSSLVQNEPELGVALEALSASRCVLKAPLGFAGRGRWWVEAGEGARTVPVQALEALRREGALVVEPWVEREGDFALHGWLSREGALVQGEPTAQRMEEGVWRESRLAAPGELQPEEHASLRAALEQSAEALAREGYFGPFGIDAFRYRSAGGQRLFRARCEVNARYSMGWAVGMGERRPELQGP